MADVTLTYLIEHGSLEGLSEDDCIKLLVEADDLYYNDEAVLTDVLYDIVRREAEELFPTNVYFTGIGSEVRGGKIKLPYTMGSLNQIYEGDYAKWVSDYGLIGEYISVSHKLDGASNMMVYSQSGDLQIAYSRGDGIEGADISRHVRKIHNVPLKIDNNEESITVRAETIISPANFAILKAKGMTTSAGKPFKNPRNMISGLMNSSENDEFVYKYIDVVAYEIVGSLLSKSKQLIKLIELGFSVVKHENKLAESLSDSELTTLLTNARNTTQYEIDGLVLDINSSTVRSRLKSDSLNPKYAVKFKVADASNLAHAKVIGVEWNLSKHGYYKPRLKLEPTELVGVTVQHATGFNARFIVENKIGPGAIVAITRAGDVVPYVLSVISGTEPDLPNVPYKWNETNVDIYTEDAEQNPDVQLQRLVDFFTSLDVPKFKEGNLKPFIELGISNPATIIDMTQEDIASVVGSKIIGKEIYVGLRDQLTNIPLYVLMGSVNLFGRGIGVRKMKKLWDAFDGDMSRCASMHDVEQVASFDTKTATKISNGFNEFMAFYESIKHKVTLSPYQAKPQGALTGMSFVCTGFRDSSLETDIVNKGGTVGSSVSSKTTYLVSSDPDSTSGKAKKARDLGVVVIGVAKLKLMLK